LGTKLLAGRLSAWPLHVFGWFGGTKQRSGAEAPADAGVRSKIECSVCGYDLAPLARAAANCPNCTSRPRARALIQFVNQHIRPMNARAGQSPLPLLAFGLTSLERRALETHFASIKAVTLFGEPHKDLEVGVDARDLSRFPDAAFAGSFGILVFDYFEEHEMALAEAARVVADGGIFFHQISAARLVEGNAAPSASSFITKRDGALNYLPDDISMASVKVGIDWFTNAMERVGFTACHINVPDAHTGESNHWFFGIRQKRDQVIRTDAIRRMETNLRDASQPGSQRKKSTHPAKMQTVLVCECKTEACYAGPQKTFSIPVKLPGADRILFEMSVPPIPESLRYCDFAEHVIDPASGEPTDQVIILGQGKIGVSDDLGQTWLRVEPKGFETSLFTNSFTTHSGRHIVQSRGWQGLNDTEQPEAHHGQLFVFSPDWELLAITKAGEAHWHGSASISESGGTIIFAEYYDNLAKYDPKFKTSNLSSRVRPCAVWRSRDDGMTWEKIFEQDVSSIRHFHTVAADSFEKGVWWLSSGDRVGECHVWRSNDDGGTWTECTDPDPDIALPPSFLRKKEVAHRHTDVVVTADHLIWGADDLLGDERDYSQSVPLHHRAGSRIYRSQKTIPLRIEEMAYIGHPIRSMIDVGPGWIITAEGKSPSSGRRPSIYFVGKSFEQVIKICDTDNYRNRASGLTYSKASRKSKDGLFFSFKGHYDLFDNSPRIAQYAISFVKDPVD
jgi:hypothetical protein